MSRSIKKILISLLSLGLLASLMTVSSSAFTTSSYLTLSPSGADLNSVSTRYKGTNLTISDSIGKQYEYDIFKFQTTEACCQRTHFAKNKTESQSGWYSIYTTGSTDTIGKVFTLDTSGALWWKSYNAIANTSTADDWYGDPNFHLRAQFTKGQDYYIAVRAYSGHIGSYKLNIKPNDDERTYSMGAGRGAVWNVDPDGIFCSFAYLYTSSIVYMTAGQVVVNYQLGRELLADSCIRDSYRRLSSRNQVEKLIDYGMITENMISKFFPESKGFQIAGDICNDTLFTFVLDSIYGVYTSDTDSLSDYLRDLERYAGIYKVNGGYDAMSGIRIKIRSIYGYNNTTKTGHSATDDLVGYVNEPGNSYEMSIYKSTTYYGENYEKGSWYSLT